MDPSGRDNTKTGTVCGMISTIMALVSIGMIFVIFVMCMGMGAVGTMGAAAGPPAGTTCSVGGAVTIRIVPRNVSPCRERA